MYWALNQILKLVYIPKRFFFNLFRIKFDVDRQIVISKNYSTQVQNKIYKKILILYLHLTQPQYHI